MDLSKQAEDTYRHEFSKQFVKLLLVMYLVDWDEYLPACWIVLESCPLIFCPPTGMATSAGDHSPAVFG